MKNTFTKIALLVLSFALLACVFVGFVNAEEVSAEESKILAQNVIYNDNVSIVYAVDATVEDAVAGNVKVAYYWEGEETVYDAVLLDTEVADNLYEGKPCFATTGVAPKALGKVAYATVYTGDAPAENAVWKSYSVAEYLYARLYENGFVNKTEADGKDYNRKLLYQNLLEYAANAQVIFNYNADELVTDYSYIYTTSDNITFDGEKTVFGYGELQVNATVVGEGTIAGWTLTDVEGTETTLETVTLTAEGVYKVAPIFGVHECLDEDNDHLCDSCGEVASTCVNANNTEDHKCDICGKVVDACADANSDGKCDVCGVYNFNVESITQTDKFTIYNAAWNGGTNTVETSFSISNTLTYNSARPDGFGKGPWWSIIDNPTNAADKVIRMNTISGWSGGGDYISHVNWAPDVAVENGDLVVFEFEFNQISGNTGKESFYFYTVYEDGTIKNNRNAVYTKGSSADTDGDGEGDANGVRLNPDTAEKAHYFAYGEWAKVRVVCDNTNKKIYYFYTLDDGASWIQCATVDNYASNSNIASIGFANKAGTFATTVAFDNVKCVKTTAEAYGITLN